MTDFFFSNVTKDISISFTQCAETCRAECINYVKYNSLSSYLWILYLALTILTLYFLIRNDDIKISYIAEITKQPDVTHIKKTVEYMLYAGILLIVAYIIVFLITINGIKVMA